MMKTRSVSSEVFSLRRDGKLDEAYQLALRLMAAPEVDEWTQKAMAWCLIDLIKKDAKASCLDRLVHYAAQLEALTIASTDEVLTKQRMFALTLCRPDGRLRSEAVALSKQARHAEAAALYRRLCTERPDDRDLNTALAWEIYGHAKQLMEQGAFDVGLVKRCLNEYLGLPVERPSKLHSCFLALAVKLAAADQLKILGFARLWDLAHLRPDDFESFVTAHGETYPSLAEKVVLQAGKAAVASATEVDAHYVLPYLDTAIQRHPANTWLQYVKAKILIGLGRHQDALSFGVKVVKEKIGEVWAWELLGIICAASDPEAALSCYCKALTCSREEKFIGKLRSRLAHLLIAKEQFERAKFEIMRVVATKTQEGQRTPNDVAQLMAQDWYAHVDAVASNDDFYATHTAIAESLLFSTLPWLAASLGERFTVPRQEGKHSTKRRVFVRATGISIEVSVSESRFPYRQLAPGAPLRVKGEFDHNKKFQLFLVEPRSDGVAWDALSSRVGVVEGINQEKQLLHVLIERGVSGVIPSNQLGGRLALGDAVAVRISKYTTKEGERYRIVSAEQTDDAPSNTVRRMFTDRVRADKGMGFTPDDIFIPPPLMQAQGIVDGDQVTGVALLNLNKKRNTWGWKAVKAVKSAAPQLV